MNIFLHAGAYTPLTMDGNIVVDGELASCYAFPDHHLAHIATVPLRWFPKIVNWISAVDNEFLYYVNIAADLERWLPSD